MTKRMKTGSRMTALVITLALFLAIGVTGGVLAKYVMVNIQKAEMVSAHFHISSNYLKDTTTVPTYTVPQAGAFEIELYNYETENIANVAAMNITYKVTVEGGSLTKVNGTDVTNISTSTYTLERGSAADEYRKTDTLTITPTAATVTVTVQSTAPYIKSLTGTFTCTLKSVPTWKIENQNNGTSLLTIYTNGYSDTITVQCNIAPDNTNNIMEGWTTGTNESLTVGPNETYKLLFFGSAAHELVDGYEITVGSSG